jgi:hypothetical protein
MRSLEKPSIYRIGREITTKARSISTRPTISTLRSSEIRGSYVYNSPLFIMAGPLLRALATAVGIDPATYNAVSQAGHFLAGTTAVFGPVAVAGCDPHAMYAGIGGAWMIVGWAAFKEGWWDNRYETVAGRGSSVEDAFFYVLGAALALGAVTWL